MAGTEVLVLDELARDELVANLEAALAEALVDQLPDDVFGAAVGDLE